ncbi:MAG: M15 family metallopeptidase [Lachnospiraceae bacterium]|nr:M15 family metallopeptidase [Lachnospiraceae bacterium]
MVQLYMFIVLSAYYSGRNFARNSKRFSVIAACLALFMVSVSFCYPYEPAQAANILFNDDAETTDETLAFADDTAPEELEEDPELEKIIAEGFEGEVDPLAQIPEYSADEILAGESVPTSGTISDESRLEEEVVLAEETIDGDITETVSDEEEAVIAWEDIKANFDKSQWSLILVNKQHPIPDDYTFTLGDLTNGMQCDERIIPSIYEMLKAAKKDGVTLVIRSPYRSKDRQTMLFNRKINKYTSQGLSYMDAYKLSSQIVTVPGASEHQLGLALDITTDNYYSLDAAFGETKGGKWLEEHAADYGFILRYPLGKEYITEIEYEPWHFRYVGKEAAHVIMDNGKCLEEFWEELN